MLKKALFAYAICTTAAAICTQPAIYQATYPFSLPPLAYAYNALEPFIDKQTMEIHHTKHHQAYVDNLNKALEPHKELHHKTLPELLNSLESLPASLRAAVRNNGGGHFNHSLFWTMMTPDAPKAPSGKLAQSIIKKFGSFTAFQEEFNAQAKSVFGSGWAWLVCDPKGELSIITTHDQEAPLAHGMQPILGLDVWEHAYYLHYQNRRPDYISAWWNVINWQYISGSVQPSSPIGSQPSRKASAGRLSATSFDTLRYSGQAPLNIEGTDHPE